MAHAKRFGWAIYAAGFVIWLPRGKQPRFQAPSTDDVESRSSMTSVASLALVRLSMSEGVPSGVWMRSSATRKRIGLAEPHQSAIYLVCPSS
jgi:hypothetical protein